MPATGSIPWGSTHWWRVIDAAGEVWCETSLELEARGALTTAAQPARLQRLYVRTDSEWRNHA